MIYNDQRDAEYDGTLKSLSLFCIHVLVVTNPGVPLKPGLRDPLSEAVCLLLKRAGAPDSKSIDQS